MPETPSCCDPCRPENKMPPSVTDVVNFLTSLGKKSTKEIEKAVVELDLVKAFPEAQPLEPGEMVHDRWMRGEMHSHPTREEIRTGPALEASGGGAPAEIRMYSSPAPQHGTTEMAIMFERIIPPMAASVKATEASIAALLVGVEAMSASVKGLVKKAEDEEDEEDEESEVVEINEAKAKALVEKARVLITKAAKAMEDVEDMDSGAARKALRAEAKRLRKSAARRVLHAYLIAKAVVGLRVGKSAKPERVAIVKGRRAEGAAVLGQISALLRANAFLKADIDVVQEEEDEDDEEEGKSKAKGADADGNQADRANGDGNQDDAAKANAAKVASLAAQMEDVLKGNAMLTTDVKGVLAMLAGRPRQGDGVVPLFSKGVEAGGPTLLDRIDQLQSAGELNEYDALAARDIVSQKGAASQGVIPIDIVKGRLARSSRAVQDLLNDFVAA